MNSATPKNNIKKISGLRHLLCKNLPKLYFPDENKKFTYIIESDPSEKSYGGILKYRYDDNTIEHHCRYYSGTFNETIKNIDQNISIKPKKKILRKKL